MRIRETPKFRYQQHLSNAQSRNIPFLLSFEQWWSVWVPYWDERGRSGLVMARHGDSGPYALGNISIISTHRNVSEMRKRVSST